MTAPSPLADDFVPDDVRRIVPEDLRAALRALRRDIHAHPELSWQEHRTRDALERALRELCGPALVELRQVADTGVVARLRGTSPGGPAIALRGDTDALPIHEETGLEYASTNAGVMHACGHDVHASWAVGAAALLARDPGPCDVLVVLQPAEETGQGARRVVESGALADAVAIFGAHVDRRFDVGQVVADDGPLAASADTFTVELVGAGAHAARPHESADPIVGAAALVSALQTIVSRRLNPAHAGVVTVGEIHAGTAPNIIPERATLRGTLRATDVATRTLLHEELRRIAAGVATAHRLEARVALADGTPPVVNDPRTGTWAREAVREVLGEAALVPLGFLNLAAEDFAWYQERMPGTFLRIGAREPGGEMVAAHSPRFAPAEASLYVGAAVLAECARVAGRAVSGASVGSSSMGSE